MAQATNNVVDIELSPRILFNLATNLNDFLAQYMFVIPGEPSTFNNATCLDDSNILYMMNHVYEYTVHLTGYTVRSIRTTVSGPTMTTLHLLSPQLRNESHHFLPAKDTGYRERFEQVRRREAAISHV